MSLKHLLNTNAIDCAFGKIEQFVPLHLLSDRATLSDLIYMIQRAKHYKLRHDRIISIRALGVVR